MSGLCYLWHVCVVSCESCQTDSRLVMLLVSVKLDKHRCGSPEVSFRQANQWGVSVVLCLGIVCTV
jgi:hypothetical protein